MITETAVEKDQGEGESSQKDGRKKSVKRMLVTVLLANAGVLVVVFLLSVWVFGAGGMAFALPFGILIFTAIPTTVAALLGFGLVSEFRKFNHYRTKAGRMALLALLYGVLILVCAYVVLYVVSVIFLLSAW